MKKDPLFPSPYHHHQQYTSQTSTKSISTLIPSLWHQMQPYLTPHTTSLALQLSSTFPPNLRTITPSHPIPNLNQQLPYPNSSYTTSLNLLQFAYFDLSLLPQSLHSHHTLHQPQFTQWLPLILRPPNPRQKRCPKNLQRSIWWGWEFPWDNGQTICMLSNTLSQRKSWSSAPLLFHQSPRLYQDMPSIYHPWLKCT